MGLTHFDRSSFFLGFVSAIILSSTILFLFSDNHDAIKENNQTADHSLGMLENNQAYKGSNQLITQGDFDERDSNSHLDANTTLDSHEFALGELGLADLTSSNLIPNNLADKKYSLQNVLSDTLTNQALLTLSEIPPYNAAKQINSSNDLLAKVLAKIQNSTNIEQRAFLLRALAEANTDSRITASNELLLSERILDRKDGVSLAMSLDNTDEKAMLAQYMLETEPEEEVILYVLEHLSSESDKAVVSQSFHTLNAIIAKHESPEIKGLALQAMMKADPEHSGVLNRVTALINAQSPNEKYQGLNLLHQQINDYGVPLSTEQYQDIQQQLSWIADDAVAPINHRIKALKSLKVLKDHY